MPRNRIGVILGLAAGFAAVVIIPHIVIAADRPVPGRCDACAPSTGNTITCSGDCPSSARPNCDTLWSRRANTENPWKQISQPEARDPNMEYRCSCN